MISFFQKRNEIQFSIFFIAGSLNCAAFTAGIIEAVLNGANFVSEHVHEKTNNLGFQPGRTQTRLYSHSVKLEA